MNKNSTLLLAGLMLGTGIPVNAEFAGETDDTYIGFQMSIPLEIKPQKLFNGGQELSLLLLEQTGGVTDGVAVTGDREGNWTLGYIRPSSSFRPGQGRLSDYTSPIMNLAGKGIYDKRYLTSIDGMEFWIYFVGGTVIIIDKFKDFFDDVNEDDATVDNE